MCPANAVGVSERVEKVTVLETLAMVVSATSVLKAASAGARFQKTMSSAWLKLFNVEVRR